MQHILPKRSNHQPYNTFSFRRGVHSKSLSWKHKISNIFHSDGDTYDNGGGADDNNDGYNDNCGDCFDEDEGDAEGKLGICFKIY
jgi:hypothetical protein